MSGDPIYRQPSHNYIPPHGYAPPHGYTPPYARPPTPSKSRGGLILFVFVAVVFAVVVFFMSRKKETAEFPRGPNYELDREKACRSLLIPTENLPECFDDYDKAQADLWAAHEDNPDNH